MSISSKINPYWVLLKDLSTEEKLSLIELLVKSIKVKPVTRKDKNIRQPIDYDNWVLQFSGTWKDFPESAEDLIELVESARTDSSRTIEVL